MQDASVDAKMLLETSLVWDNVWPLEPWCGNDLEDLHRLQQAGWNVVSLTIAGDNHGSAEAFLRLARIRHRIGMQPELMLVERFDDIETARQQGRLAVTLHFEGARTFGRDLEVIAAFRELGVTHNILAFNNANDVAGGCMERVDGGLTAWGHRVVREMERVGMIVDLSHTGRRSSLDALGIAQRPMIFSHSNADAVAPHPRNITDEQARACAATGGLVGLSGSSDYLGDPSASTEALYRHVEHFFDVVGEDHVALGLDIVFDEGALNEWARSRPDEWPMTTDPDWPGFRYAAPRQLEQLVEQMIRGGYSSTAIAKFLGGNHRRLMEVVLA